MATDTTQKGESAVSVSHRRLLVSHHRTLLVGENYYSFHKQEWKTITRLAAKQVRMHVNRAHIDWVHVMHIQAQAKKRLIIDVDAVIYLLSALAAMLSKAHTVIAAMWRVPLAASPAASPAQPRHRCPARHPVPGTPAACLRRQRVALALRPAAQSTAAERSPGGCARAALPHAPCARPVSVSVSHAALPLQLCEWLADPSASVEL